MSIDNLTLRNLVHVRRLYMHGIEHSINETEIDRTVSILHLDNAIERLLYCILTFKGEPPKESNFPILWEKTEKAIEPRRILSPFKRGVFELHQLRNNVQHLGIIPSSEDLLRYGGFTKEFLTEIIMKVFNLDLERISLSLLIRNEKVRDLFTKAERAFELNDYENCLLNCLKTFVLAKRDEQSRIYGSGLSWKLSSLARYPSIRKLEPDLRRIVETQTDRELSGFYQVVYSAFEVIGEELEVLKLRMDYKEYRRFADIYPSYYLTIESKFESIKPGYCTKENAFFALNFVLECILRWESLKRPSWQEYIRTVVKGAEAARKELDRLEREK